MSAVVNRDSDKLLPGATNVPSIVLFCTAHETTEKMRKRFDCATWPRGYRVCQIDLDNDPEARSWFALDDERPAVAVVLDGAILALEYECSDEACQRLLRTAQALQQRMDEI